MSVSNWSILKSLKLLSTEAKGNFSFVIYYWCTSDFHVYYISFVERTVNILFVLHVRMSPIGMMFYKVHRYSVSYILFVCIASY
jgi:hypothetical protein